MAFETEISLVVLDGIPEQERIRAFWNANENDVLEEVPTEDRLWLGRTRAVTPEEPRSPGRAGRVFDLIYLRGTTPVYTAPLITEELIGEIMGAFAAEDDSGLPATEAARLRGFLTSHLDKYLVTEG